MSILRHRRRSRPVFALDLLVLGLVVAGIIGIAFGRQGGAPPVSVSGVLPEQRTPIPQAGRARTQDESRPVKAPSRLAIPSIGVRTNVIRLGLNPDRTLGVPTDYSVAGWYALGPKPGETGAAVIVGHVDSKEGPGVFFRLGEVAPGDLLRVTSPNRVALRFRVYAVREYPKAAFPTALVYGQTAKAELRLITCGGPFDTATGHYLDNVVVFARQVETLGGHLRYWPRGSVSGWWSRTLAEAHVAPAVRVAKS
jgi:sortase (surface protein transpeptidase)